MIFADGFVLGFIAGVLFITGLYLVTRWLAERRYRKENENREQAGHVNR